jgi:hypothetical protein
MSAHFWPRSSAANRRSALWQFRLPAILAARALQAQNCGKIPPRPFQGADAFNSNVRVPTAAYRSARGTYSSKRSVELAPWLASNNQDAPTHQMDGQ